MILARYCMCGGSIRATASNPLSESLAADFDARHVGEGHGPATTRQAAHARRRKEQEARS